MNRLRTVRRRWIVLVVVLLIVIVEVRLLDSHAPIDYYRVVDDRTVVVGAGTGPTLWARVTNVSEAASSVTVEVSAIRAPVPSTGDQITELTVNLRDSIDGRTMIDASSGLPIPRR